MELTAAFYFPHFVITSYIVWHSSFHKIAETDWSDEGICFLRNQRHLYGHAVLVLTKWLKFRIEVVQEQKAI